MGGLLGALARVGGVPVSIGALDSQSYQGVWPAAYLHLSQVRKGWTGAGRWSSLGVGVGIYGYPMGDGWLPEDWPDSANRSPKSTPNKPQFPHRQT